MKCEDAILTVMAAIDGEKIELSRQQATAHLADCGKCRQDFEQLQTLSKLLEKQQRCEQTSDLWRSLENRLQVQAEVAPRLRWQPFLLLAALLVSYKLLEMIPERDLGFLFKLVPLIFVVVLFRFLRENPFKINTELTLEK